MTTLPFNMNDVYASFTRQDVSRGQDYARRGAVTHLEINDNGRQLTAQVQGTQRSPYTVSVRITQHSPHRAFIYTSCSCPVHDSCKHGVAVCVKALSAKPTYSTPSVSSPAIQKVIQALPPEMQGMVMQTMPATTRPDPTDLWLNALEAQANIPAPRAPKKIFVYIVDALQKSHLLQVSCQVYLAAILKNGQLGALQNIRQYELHNTSSSYHTPEDVVIAQMMRGAEPYSAGFCSPPVNGDMFNLILSYMIASGRCFLKSHDTAPLTEGSQKHARLGWKVHTDGSQTPSAIIEEDVADSYIILPAAHPWYVNTATRQAGPLIFDVPLKMVHKFLEGPRIAADDITRIANRMATHSLAKTIETPAQVTIENRPSMPPTPCLRLSYIKRVLNEDAFQQYPVAWLHFDYDGVTVDPNGAADTLRQQKGSHLIVQPRDIAVENRAVLRLTGYKYIHPISVSAPDIPACRLAYMFTHPEDVLPVWIHFLQREVPRLQADGWRVTVDEAFAEHFHAIEVDVAEDAWQANMQEQQGSDWWFSLDIGIMVEGQRIALLPLLVQALQMMDQPSAQAIETMAVDGYFYVRLPDRRNLALPFDRVRDILTTLVELYDRPLNKDGSLTVSVDLATALARIEAATKMRWMGSERLRTLMEQLKNFSGITPVPPPKRLKATLRPYQCEGLNWLQFLRDYNLGGILADDMGLGKTVQTLAHILVEKEAKRMEQPCLIICPTSLIPNWQDEARKFAPSLKVLSLHGKERAARFGDIARADVVLTTYPLVLRDAEILHKAQWHLVVLDEAQAIKNPAAKVTQLICELNAKHRLCLTGTPIENHLGEAWSQFAFVMPGMLGTHKEFTKRFRNPIEKHKDTERQAVLARRLKPFILRRNKSEVAKELPPKTEIIHHVELEAAQRDLYETVRLTMHEKVQEAVASKGFSRSHIVILDALLKLRQVCCDPRLVKLAGAKKVKRSAKLESLMEMLPEMIEEGRRILLFSQFTSMLDIIREELHKRHIPFAEIRGDTKDRKTPVQQFQSGKIPLFLISLKAGGTGLNLTAADTVIHYDPWWNPAVENQATDRAHRIGQNKPVFVYKFIAKGTVEERILELQDRKRSLAAALLEERPDATAAFAADDLDFLFRQE